MQTPPMLKRASFWLLLLVIAGLFSCGKEKDLVLTESSKDIQGTWKIFSVTRNGVDITTDFDFSNFRITFNQDGSYALQNPVPFIVAKNGKWQLDDPSYPIHITFNQDGSPLPLVNEFTYPIEEGVRHMVLTGSPGCIKNSYQYSLTYVGK